MNEEKSNLDSDVILAYLKLSRAMRRCPPERKYLPFPPAVGRLLECAAANPGVCKKENFLPDGGRKKAVLLFVQPPERAH